VLPSGGKREQGERRMSELLHLKSSPHLENRKATKFTPQNIRQIINLVERGKKREEIAEIIGVTVGSLAVTCSKLGISLRRPVLGPGMRPVSRLAPRNDQNAVRQIQIQVDQPPRQSRPSDRTTVHVRMDTKEIPPDRQPTGAPQSSPVLGIVIKYKGESRTTELPLSADVIGLLAIEAEFRGVKLAELVARLLAEITKKDLFGQVLDGSP